MAHWLIKSEPSVWSWDDQVKAGAKGTHWDGVKNHTAKLNLMAMKLGEQVFFYHSNEGLEVVGIVEVIKEAYNWIPGEPPPGFGLGIIRLFTGQLEATFTLTGDDGVTAEVEFTVPTMIDRVAA